MCRCAGFEDNRLNPIAVHGKIVLLEGDLKMPIISMFYGIIIRMYTEPGNKHHLHHLHAEYGD